MVKQAKVGPPDSYRAVSLSAYLGAALRRRRVLRGFRQEDIAATARSWGLRWARSDVAAIEAGRRSFSVEEFLLLPWVAANEGPAAVKRGQDRPVEMGDLFPGQANWIVLTQRFIFSDVAVRAILRDEAGSGGLGTWFQDAPSSGLHGGDLRRMSLAGIAEKEAVLRRLWPDKPPDRELVTAADADKLGDAEQKAARRLRTFPLAVAAAARKRWGRSFAEERDRRLVEAETSEANPRTRQAFRGHVSRALLEELREEGIEALKAKRPVPTRAKGKGRRR